MYRRIVAIMLSIMLFPSFAYGADLTTCTIESMFETVWHSKRYVNSIIIPTFRGQALLDEYRDARIEAGRETLERERLEAEKKAAEEAARREAEEKRKAEEAAKKKAVKEAKRKQREKEEAEKKQLEELRQGLTADDMWVVDEPGYVKAMTEKANLYLNVEISGCYDGTRYLGTDTGWFILVDCDYCRIMWFRFVDGAWKLVGGQNCSVGCRGIEAAQRGVYSGSATRSCTFKGIMKVLPTRYQEMDGMLGGLCFVPCNGRMDGQGNYVTHMNENSSCYCQKIHSMCGRCDPNDAILPTDSTWFDYVPFLDSRFTSLGCVCVRDDTAMWNFENIPDLTNIVIFDRWNPTPGLGGADSRVYAAGYSDAFDLYHGDSNIPALSLYDQLIV